MIPKLRPYQEQAIAAEAQHRAEHPDETRLAIVMATGLGKGMIIAARAVRFIENPMSSGLRVLILAHTDEIITDLAKRGRLLAGQSKFPISVGIVKAESDEVSADIVIASTQTLLDPRRRERIKDVGLVLVDECELYAAPQWEGILRHYGCFGEPCLCLGCENAPGHQPCSYGMHLTWSESSGTPCTVCVATDSENMAGRTSFTPALGFTATLERGDGQGLGRIWQDVCFSRDISWGVRHGYLVQPVGHRLEIELDGSEMAGATHFTTGNATALDMQMADSIAPARIVEKWLELASDRQTVAFMPLVRSANKLRDAFRAAGIRAETIYGDMPDELRRAYLERHAGGYIQVLCNAMVLTRGWDSPGTKCVIVGRPTKIRNLGIQMAGRGLRPVPGIPVEDQDCLLIYVQDATTDLFTHADLSDRPLDRRAEGALTAMEDEWDIGAALEDQARHWTGKVDATQFDPLVARSSKVWKRTKGGTLYLPISDRGEYVFVVGTSVFSYTRRDDPIRGEHKLKMRASRLHKDLPDLELALSVAEDEAQERGGDLGRLLADKDRPWRKAVPSAEMQARAQQLGLGKELISIMEARAGGKAGKVSDLISRVVASRAIDPMVERIKEATK